MKCGGNMANSKTGQEQDKFFYEENIFKKAKQNYHFSLNLFLAIFIKKEKS